MNCLLMMLDSGTVQELFQNDIRKVPSDAEGEFESRNLREQNILHASHSLISLDPELLYNREIYREVSTLLKPEGNLTSTDESDRENRTKFGLETIVEEMHDQSEEAADEFENALAKPNSGNFNLVYDEYEIDLRGQTSEELRRSEEFQRLLSLLLKPKDDLELTKTLTEIQNGDAGPEVVIETTTDRKVECTMREVKNMKYYLRGDGEALTGIKPAEEVSSECLNKSYEMKKLESLSEHTKTEHPRLSHPKLPSHEVSPPETPTTKPKRFNGRSKSGKVEKKHGGSKKLTKSGDREKQGWLAKFSFSSLSNAACNKVKDYIVFIQKQNASGNWSVQSILGGISNMSVANVIRTVAGLVFMIIFVGVLFYKPPGMVDELMHRLGRRRTPLQAFYDTLLTILHGIIR